MSLTLDVWLDLVCPWCYIGKRRLEEALASEVPGSYTLRWRAFQLQPDLPPEGIEAEAYYNEKFGGPERVQEMFARVTEVAATDDIELRQDRQKRAPNTRLAHRAGKLAPDPTAAIETLFAAHFTQGEDLADRETLLRLLPELDPEQLDSDAAAAEVDEDLELARQLGISGVPFFVADMSLAVSGAQPAEVLTQMIAQARG